MTAPPPDPPPAAPKAAPPPLMGRAPRPGAVRIRKSAVQLAVLAAAGLLAGALAWAFVVQPDLRAHALRQKADDRPLQAGSGARPADQIVGQPASYDRLPAAAALPPPRGAPDPASLAAPAEVRPAARAYGPPPSPLSSTASSRSEIRARAAASALFFQDPVVGMAALPASDTRPPAGPAPDLAATHNPDRLEAPLSPYELKAGAIVSAVLLTGLDTARPGPVLAAVSRDVYDSVTGRHLLLPQGARLVGRHEGESAYGDRRAFLVWDRLILPNGKSLRLMQEPGVDARGAVGVRGRADRRLLELGVAALVSGAISTVGQFARGGARDDDRGSFLGHAGDAAAIEAAQVGGRLIDRELAVRPTVRVEAGTPVRVLITRDLILEPYRR